MENSLARLKAALHKPLLLWAALVPLCAGAQPVVPADLALQPDIAIATNIATADSVIYVAARPAVGTDGTNYLVVSKRSDFVSHIKRDTGRKGYGYVYLHDASKTIKVSGQTYALSNADSLEYFIEHYKPRTAPESGPSSE